MAAKNSAPRPGAALRTTEPRLEARRTPAWPCENAESLTEKLVLDSTPDLVPRLQFQSAGVKCLHSALDLGLPCRRRPGIGRAVKTGQEFGGELRSFRKAEAQSVCQNAFRGFGHAPYDTPRLAAQQPVEPAGPSCHGPCLRTARARPPRRLTVR